MPVVHGRSETASTPGAAYPLVLTGDGFEALVVGGGGVAARKVESLLAAGVRVRIVATRLGDRCRALVAAAGDGALSVTEREYRPEDVGDAMLVIAATDARKVNERVAADARRLRRLVNVVDRPDEGNCITPATHRAGPLTIAVSAGGVPGAAVRIRDAIAERFDGRYAAAVGALAALRQRLLGGGVGGDVGGGVDGDVGGVDGDVGGGVDGDVGGSVGGSGAEADVGRAGADWREASDELIGPDFCRAVEDGSFTERLSRWD
ncbi:MAG TPA: bifunctional precorrin-2 dehydrogenase/sirohydrochlorin ferrochelatase [Gemmatimonadaceae bacterium]|nr:bifunctional precorrin-2 dehydrogenase/sirohydrochlorin ferrochelatase [Gemmatimonadaceae bacterium]